MKAIVTRTLHIKSPLQLSDILIKSDLIENELFKYFCFITSEYLKGCKCVSDPYYSLMIDEYNRISSDTESINFLKDKIKANIIIDTVESI